MLLETEQKTSKILNSKFDTFVDIFYGNWIWRATHALIDHQDFSGSASWVSQRLGVSIQEAVEALEGLEYLGLMQKTSDGIVAKNVSFICMPDDVNNKKMLSNHRVVSEQTLNKMVCGNYQGYRIDFAASNKETIKNLCLEFYKKIDEFRLKSDALTKKDGVFGVTFSAVLLSNEDSKRGTSI